MIKEENKPRSRVIRISGPFTTKELAQFTALLRDIDRTRPKEIFKMSITDEETTLEESETLLRHLLPPLPDRATEFARLSYIDESFPARNCDRCQRRYQGPAVYCSLECALADA